jgi:hypothetical protein
MTKMTKEKMDAKAAQAGKETKAPHANAAKEKEVKRPAEKPQGKKYVTLTTTSINNER